MVETKCELIAIFSSEVNPQAVIQELHIRGYQGAEISAAQANLHAGFPRVRFSPVPAARVFDTRSEPRGAVVIRLIEPEDALRAAEVLTDLGAERVVNA